MARTLVLISYLLTFSLANGQDRVVTARLDTIRGEVNILTYDIFDRVEVTPADDPKKKTKSLKAVEVREVISKGDIYHPQLTYDGYRMLKLKTAGYLSLYYGHRPKQNIFDVQCLVKKDGKYLEIPGFTFKRTMSNFLSECGTVKLKIDDGRFTRDSIDQIVAQFNQCITDRTPKASATPAVTTAATSPIDKIIGRLEKDDQLPDRKDVLDLAKDIQQKIRDGKEVPRYMTEGLKNSLKDATPYQEDLAALLAQVEKK